MQLPQDRHQQMQPSQHPRRKDCIPTHADVQRAIARLLEAVRLVPVRRVDDDAVAAVLERDGDVDDEALGAANAEIGMNDDHIGSCHDRNGPSVGGSPEGPFSPAFSPVAYCHVIGLLLIDKLIFSRILSQSLPLPSTMDES